MAQTAFALLTTTGRAREAAALANGTAVTITHIAIGDGATVPSGAETHLYHEVARKPISGHGTVAGAANVAWFDAFLAAGDGPFTIREAGLIDSNGDLIAIAHYDPPLNKPVPASGQTVEATLRLEVAFSNTAAVTIVIDPSIQVALQRLARLPWLPVVSMTIAAPPAATPGSAYLIPAGGTGAWAGQAGRIAEYTTAGWAILTPPDGHGIGLPDGRVFVRLGGSYVELAATEARAGMVRLATAAEAKAGTATDRALTPAGLVSANLALAAETPIFPEILTGSGSMTCSIAGPAIVIDAGQRWRWRGLVTFGTDSFAAEARTFAFGSDKTYHLRWHASGTGTAKPAATFPQGRFELLEVSSASDPTTAYDSTFDRMLIARVVTDAANAPTVTALKNLNRLYAKLTKNTGESTPGPGGWNGLPMLTGAINWARTPRASIVYASCELTTGVDALTRISATGNRYQATASANGYGGIGANLVYLSGSLTIELTA